MPKNPPAPRDWICTICGARVIVDPQTGEARCLNGHVDLTAIRLADMPASPSQEAR